MILASVSAQILFRHLNSRNSTVLMGSRMPEFSSAPPLPHSATKLVNPAAQSTSSKQPVDAATNDNWALNIDEKKPELPDKFEYLESADYIEKFKKYEADYTRRLMAKYFSKKNLYGGEIFDENTLIDNEIIKSSRWPCTKSFADPLQSFEEQTTSCCSTSSTETPNNNSNGTHQPKKSG